MSYAVDIARVIMRQAERDELEAMTETVNTIPLKLGGEVIVSIAFLAANHRQACLNSETT